MEIYINNKKIIEDKENEFKNFSFESKKPSIHEKFTIIKNIIAFFNSGNFGTLWIGVSDDYKKDHGIVNTSIIKWFDDRHNLDNLINEYIYGSSKKDLNINLEKINYKGKVIIKLVVSREKKDDYNSLYIKEIKFKNKEDIKKGTTFYRLLSNTVTGKSMSKKYESEKPSIVRNPFDEQRYVTESGRISRKSYLFLFEELNYEKNDKYYILVEKKLSDNYRLVDNYILAEKNESGFYKKQRYRKLSNAIKKLFELCKLDDEEASIMLRKITAYLGSFITDAESHFSNLQENYNWYRIKIIFKNDIKNKTIENFGINTENIINYFEKKHSLNVKNRNTHINKIRESIEELRNDLLNKENNPKGFALINTVATDDKDDIKKSRYVYTNDEEQITIWINKKIERLFKTALDSTISKWLMFYTFSIEKETYIDNIFKLEKKYKKDDAKEEIFILLKDLHNI